MKKSRFLLLLLALCPLMSACQDKEHSVISINNVGDANPFVEVFPTTVSDLIKHKQDFVLEIYRPTCESCKELEPNLEKYCKKQSKVIYRLNTSLINEEAFNSVLKEPYPEIFHDDYVPNILYISEGKLTYEVSPNKFGSYTGLKSVMNKHFTASNITMINDLNSFTTYRQKNENYICFFYNYSNEYSIKFAAEYLINADIVKNKTPVLLINKNTLGFENFNSVKFYYETDSSSFACIVKNNEIKRTLDYSFDDGSELKKLIASF